MGKPEQSLGGTPSAKTKKFKKWLPLILAILVTFGIMIGFMPAYFWAKQIVIIVKNPNDNILVCKRNGGEWLVGAWEHWWCRYRTNDWGKVCFSKSDCSGHCLGPGGGSMINDEIRNAENGYCSKYNDGADNGASIICTFEKGSPIGNVACIVE